MKKAAASSILVAMGLLTLAVIAEAQQPKKVTRIGYLSALDPATESEGAGKEAMLMGMKSGR